jgi:predicted DNA-binding protein
VKTITLQLPEAVIMQVNALAKTTAKKPSEIMRNAITKEVESARLEMNGLDTMEDIIGLIPDGPADLARNHKAYLRSKIRDKTNH